jgi:hypothetical protein
MVPIVSVLSFLNLNLILVVLVDIVSSGLHEGQFS